MDEFTKKRIINTVTTFRKKHGRDIGKKDFNALGFSIKDVEALVRKGVLKKLQVKTGDGAVENRFVVAKDWRELSL